MSQHNYTEKELLYPALFFIKKYEGEIGTSDLIDKLSSSLNLSDEDSEILFGRNDTRFSQKVRNLISHKTLLPYIKYSSESSSSYIINDEGVAYLQDKKNKLVEFSEIEETETTIDTIDSFPGLKEFIYDVEVRVNLVNQTVFELYRRYEMSEGRNQRGGLILDDTFQRKAVWTLKQQSQLIESILIGIPLPLFYLVEDKKANLVVVDGRQRLTSIFRFLNDEYKLTGLQMLRELNGMKISDFTEELEILRARIEDSFLYVARIDKNTPEIIKLQIFSRVNRNGTPLNNQEVRHALHQGAVTVVLSDLSNTLGLKVSNTRMKDRQYILRALSLQLFHSGVLINYETGLSVEYKNIDEFLGDSMDAINTFNQEQLKEHVKDFEGNYNRAIEIFEDNAFRLNIGTPINMILFEITLLLVHINKERDNATIKKMYNEFIEFDDEGVTKTKEDYTWFEQNIRFHRDSRENLLDRIFVLEKIKEKWDDKKNNDK